MRSSGPRHPHPIRLRGPWHYQVLEAAAPAASPVPQPDAAAVSRATASGKAPAAPNAEAAVPRAGKLRLPADWSSLLGHGFRGRVRFTRHFHCPRGLDAHERVWLVCEGADARALWRVNANELPPIAGYALWAEADITDWLEPRNELQLDVELPPDIDRQHRPGRQLVAGGPIGDVRLEVRRRHWIDALELGIAWIADRPLLDLHARVCGPPTTAPLELVVELDGRELAWLPCQVGKPVSLSLPLEHPRLWPEHLLTARVRLLQGGQRIWECRRITGVREVHWVPSPEPALEMRGNRLPLPWPALDPFATVDVATWPTRSVERAVRNGLLLEAIFPEATYARLDQIGAKVIQAVPQPWAAQVCGRLMHHPSIVAWCDADPTARLDSSGPATPPHIRYGRLWLHRIVATAPENPQAQETSEQAGSSEKQTE